MQEKIPVYIGVAVSNKTCIVPNIEQTTKEKNKFWKNASPTPPFKIKVRAIVGVP